MSVLLGSGIVGLAPTPGSSANFELSPQAASRNVRPPTRKTVDARAIARNSLRIPEWGTEQEEMSSAGEESAAATVEIGPGSGHHGNGRNLDQQLRQGEGGNFNDCARRTV